jgi:predicted nucleic acid-binding Zn ribbon protein
MPFPESRVYGRRHYPVRNQTASLTTTCQKVSKSTIFGALGRIADFERLRLQMAGFPAHVDIASLVSPNETRNCRTCSEAVQLPSWQSGISTVAWRFVPKAVSSSRARGPGTCMLLRSMAIYRYYCSTGSNVTDVIGSLNSKNKPTCHQCNQRTKFVPRLGHLQKMLDNATIRYGPLKWVCCSGSLMECLSLLHHRRHLHPNQSLLSVHARCSS